MAVMLSWKVRGQAVYRTLFFLPSVVPVVAVVTVAAVMAVVVVVASSSLAVSIMVPAASVPVVLGFTETH